MRSRWLLLVSSIVTFLVTIPVAVTGCGGSSNSTPSSSSDFSLSVSPTTAS